MSPEDKLASTIVELLRGRNETVAFAESCTGGFVMHCVTNIPGASEVFRCGWVTYANEAKENFLDVSAEILARHGAVSEPAAQAMARGARARAKTTYAVAVTGIAGPSGGGEEKPVGTVFIAFDSAEETRVIRRLNAFDRKTFKSATAIQALDLLARGIRGELEKGKGKREN